MYYAIYQSLKSNNLQDFEQSNPNQLFYLVFNRHMQIFLYIKEYISLLVSYGVLTAMTLLLH